MEDDIEAKQIPDEHQSYCEWTPDFSVLRICSGYEDDYEVFEVTGKMPRYLYNFLFWLCQEEEIQDLMEHFYSTPFICPTSKTEKGQKVTTVTILDSDQFCQEIIKEKRITPSRSDSYRRILWLRHMGALKSKIEI